MKYLREKLIDFIFRRKSLIGCLYFTLVFFISQLGVIGQSNEINNYCERIQKRNPENWKYDVAELIKIIYADGNLIALIVSGSIILVLIGLIIYTKKKSSINVDLVEIFEDGLL